MSNVQTSQKTLEVKIRPYPGQIQESKDLKGVARVYLSSDALLDLGLRPGQVCALWRPNEPENQRREAIAWNTPEKSMGKKVVQISRALQEASGFKLAEELKITAVGDLKVSESLVLRDVTANDSPETEPLGDERVYWEWYLKDYLYRAEVVFSGMMFKNITYGGVKRSFIVSTVNGRSTDTGKFDVAVTSVTVNSSLPEPEINGTNGALPVLRVDIEGIGQALAQLNQFLDSFNHPILFPQEKPACAVLIHGSRGTGKTYLMDKVIATGWAKKIIRINEDTTPTLLPRLFRDAKLNSPSIIALDNFESLFAKEDKAATTFKRIFGEELDRLTKEQQGSVPRVLVIAATLDPSKIPLELKNERRFETEILLPVPDAAARKAILSSCHPAFHPDRYEEALNKLGDRTHAYTARDLVKLLDRTHRLAKARILLNGPVQSEESYFLLQEDIDLGLQQVRPTAMHDITLQPPPVRWDEIGGQAAVKEALRRAVETPLKHPKLLKRLGCRPQKGILLYGPPGCSKTLTAQAMATSGNFNFFAVKGAELLNMYVGESERAIRNIFARAEAAKPAVIFFDEIDSIASGREGGKNGGVQVLATMLNCMDGIEALNGVFVLAATNRPDVLDSALLRPGRFDQSIYVPLPSLSDRVEILQVQRRKMDFATDVDIEEIARLTDGYSGAELAAVCQRACDPVIAKCEETGEELKITMQDLRYGASVVKKQVRPESLAVFERFARRDEGLGDRSVIGGNLPLPVGPPLSGLSI